MKLPPEHFAYCPSCGKPVKEAITKSLTCDCCGFTYFFNPTIGTAGFIENGRGEVLLIKRGKDPAKGKLAPPGGFADYGETAEEALTREVREETGMEIFSWKYLLSAVNWYTYKEVTYPVIDFFYSSRIDNPGNLDLCDTETAGASWMKVDSIAPEELAFPSMQKAFKAFRSGNQ